MKGYQSATLFIGIVLLSMGLPSLVTVAFLWVFLRYLLVVREIWKDQVHYEDLEKVLDVYSRSLLCVRIALYISVGLGCKVLWCEFEPEVKVAYVVTLPFVGFVLLSSKFWHRSIKPLIRQYRIELRNND